MQRFMQACWKEDDGVLAFEWILLATLIALGIVAGVAAVRDAMILELGDLSQAISNVDQSFTVNDPPAIMVQGSISGGAANSGFVDATNVQVVQPGPPIPQQTQQNAQ